LCIIVRETAIQRFNQGGTSEHLMISHFVIRLLYMFKVEEDLYAPSHPDEDYCRTVPANGAAVNDMSPPVLYASCLQVNMSSY
jgi:hypothetical protein